MGNRAVITADGKVGIYLHWNGGPESVLAFLHAARDLGIRSDAEYFPARFVQMVGNFFGGVTSLGIGRVGQLDDSDNGTYTIKGFAIVKRTQAGPVRVEELTPNEREKYDLIYSGILKNQRAAFEEQEGDIVIRREKT